MTTAPVNGPHPAISARPTQHRTAKHATGSPLASHLRLGEAVAHDASRLLPDAGLLAEQCYARVRRVGLDRVARRPGPRLEMLRHLVQRTDLLRDIAHDPSSLSCTFSSLWVASST